MYNASDLTGERTLVCNRCLKPFTLISKTSWLSAERAACPYCQSHDTTPMLQAVTKRA